MLDERDAFDYPQDYRRWVESGRPSGLHLLDDVIREFCPEILEEEDDD